MSVYDVWAPTATTVQLHLDGAVLPLEHDASTGWWRAPADLDRSPGHRYGFFVDDGETPLPDPRSRRQPDGVHGLSETWDGDSFDWTDASWTGRQLAGAVIYELHVGTFTPDGTLDSAIAKLPHLVELGVDLVELLPVNGVNGRWNWGYDGVDWFTVTDNYGGPDAYQRFVDAAHASGLGVVQDVVYNHLGPSGNYLPAFGPYLSSKHANTWGDNVNLDDEGSHEVREFILDNALMWFERFHVDALRLDAVHALVDDSPVHLLQEMGERTAALSAHLSRPLTLIAESDLNDATLVTPRDGGGFGPDHRQGYGLDGQWSDDFHHALHVALTGETNSWYADFASLDSLAKVVTKGFFHDGTWSSFREADHGHPVDVAHMPAWRLVVANQNHDQIGNRAVGDRLAATLDDGQLQIAAALTLTSPYTPMLFMGEEWGASTPWQFFTSHPEKELGEATAKGRIAEFAKSGWDESVVPDPQDPQTFEDSKLDWSELGRGRHALLLDAYQQLTALRRAEPELTDPRLGHTSVEHDAEAGWFVMTRGTIRVAANFGAQEARPGVRASSVLFASDDSIAAGAELVLPPHSVAVVR